MPEALGSMSSKTKASQEAGTQKKGGGEEVGKSQLFT